MIASSLSAARTPRHVSSNCSVSLMIRRIGLQKENNGGLYDLRLGSPSWHRFRASSMSPPSACGGTTPALRYGIPIQRYSVSFREGIPDLRDMVNYRITSCE